MAQIPPASHTEHPRAGNQPERGPQNHSRNSAVIILVAVLAAVLASALTVWLLVSYFFPQAFQPVQLNEREQQVLSAKLERLDTRIAPGKPGAAPADGRLQPEPYREDDAAREIILSERELNALLANNTELARQLAIDLSDDMASARLLLPLDPDFPVLGGKTLKLSAGLELAYANGRPVVALRGLSLWGVPMPNAWLGGLKNVDLVSEFGADGGFWSAFADGVEYVKVTDGKVQIKLKE